uniref:Translocon-associated protein subunit delta n=1 Tax=Heterorhabditis bacteriophora TaxID=37862 RepID=A0A1I7XSH8_HETBA
MMRTILLAWLSVAAYATKCESPKHSSTSFSTTDGFFHFQTTFIAEFTLQCSNNIKTAKYQVSWSQEHEKSEAQTFQIKIFDEDGISAFVKNADTKPLFTIEHYHAGLTRKSPVSSETVALFVCIAALYYAVKQKAEISH